MMGAGEDEGRKTESLMKEIHDKDNAKAFVAGGYENDDMDDMWLCTRTAEEIRTFLREERITPEQLISVVSRRIEDVNGQLHAVITTCFDRARAKLEEVKEHMRSFRARGRPFPPGYLYGMPVLIKDTNYVKGVRFTMGFYGQDEDEDNVKRREFTDSDPLVLQVCFSGHVY